MFMNWQSQSILRSLQTAPLLVGDLPEAACFDRSDLNEEAICSDLNFDQKLGHLYESGLEALLQTSKRWELVTSHLQVSDAAGRTLGELDFVVQDTLNQKWIHLELAVKFYLAFEDPERGWCYPGPDPRDNWQAKLNHMRFHQLIMGTRSGTRDLLKKRFEIDQIETQQLIYGRLFYPMNQPNGPLPEAIKSNVRRSRWLYVKEWSHFFPQIETVLEIEKALWPVSITQGLKNRLPKIKVDQLLRNATERCQLCVVEGSMEPIFVVPNTWNLISSERG